LLPAVLIAKNDLLAELASGLTHASTVPIVKLKTLPVLGIFTLSPAPSKCNAPPNCANDEVFTKSRKTKRKACWKLFLF